MAARQQLGTAVTNDQLLESALAYLTLLDAVQRKAIAAETLENGRQLASITAEFARSGAGNQADADRTSAALALLKNETSRANEMVAVAAARLAQQAMALTNRPELGASRSLVCEAVNRLRREQNAPWLPSIILGVSYGAFAGGVGGKITNGADRFDFDGVAYWELRNLGLGEKAARANSNAQVQQARLREVEMMDLVAREVVEAHAQIQARHEQVSTAQGAIESAESSYRLNLERMRNGQGLPIEVLQSIHSLDATRRDYLRAIVDYNQAQFRLQRALGWPVQTEQARLL